MLTPLLAYIQTLGVLEKNFGKAWKKISEWVFGVFCVGGFLRFFRFLRFRRLVYVVVE